MNSPDRRRRTLPPAVYLVALGTLLLGLGACSDPGAAPTGPNGFADPTVSASVLPAGVDACGDVTEIRLLAGQDIDVGSVTIANDENDLYVTYTTEDGWAIQTTHLAVATSLDDVPTNDSGNPVIGDFSHKGTHDGITQVTYTIALSELEAQAGDGLIVAAHADVGREVDGRSETAWAEGILFIENGGSWATYAAYTVQECIVVLAPGDLCSNHDAEDIATFADPNLEAAVREALALLGDEPITCGDLTLEVLLANRRGIADLAGIQNLTDLRVLGLTGNEITDISWLSYLTRLEGLGVSVNQISDISPVSTLTSLRQFSAQTNLITDISPLSGLTELGTLQLGSNQITDVSALAGLDRLHFLGIEFNEVDDLSPLAGLTRLRKLGLAANGLDDTDMPHLSELTGVEFLGLRFNDITDISILEDFTALTELRLNGNHDLADIQPLIDNTGLGSGDFVKLTSTSVTCDAVAALEAEGVTVEADCP